MNSAQKAKSLLQKQESMNVRMQNEQLSASKQAAAMGLQPEDQDEFVNQHLEEYQRTEIIRRSVNDVRRRAKEQEEKRKMRHKAYSGVKSKIAGNMRVIDKTNQDKGYVNPHLVDAKKRPMSTATLNKIKSRSPVKGMGQSQRGGNLDNTFYSDIVFQNGGSRTINNSAQKSQSLNTSDDDLLARFQSQAKNKMSASPYRDMNFTDDKTKLKMPQNEPQRREEPQPEPVRAPAPQMMSQSMTNMSNVKSQAQFQSSGDRFQTVDVGAELETPIAVRGGNNRVNQSQTIQSSASTSIKQVEFSPSPMSRGKKSKKSKKGSPERIFSESEIIEIRKMKKSKKSKAPADFALSPEWYRMTDEEIEEGLNSIQAGDITELKALKNPPQGVINVCKAVATLFGLPDDLTWPLIQKQLLSNMRLVQMFKGYDKDNIPDSLIRKVNVYTSQRDFIYDSVRRQSAAAANLCAWVRAIEEYHNQKNSGPKVNQVQAQQQQQVHVEQQQKQRASQVTTTQVITTTHVERREERKEAVRGDISDRSQLSQVSLDRAQRGIHSVKQSDITELKALRKPTDTLKIVFDAAQILLQGKMIPVTKATINIAKQEVPFIESSFEQHTVRLLQQPLLQNLLHFINHELDHITDETIELLEPYLNAVDTQNPPQYLFTPQKAKNVSAALEGMVIFIQSVYDYHNIQNGIKPEPRPEPQPSPQRSPKRKRSPSPPLHENSPVRGKKSKKGKKEQRTPSPDLHERLYRNPMPKKGKKVSAQQIRNFPDDPRFKELDYYEEALKVKSPKKGKKARAKVDESQEVESIAASSYAGAASTSTTPEETLQNALEALNGLTRADITEFSSFINPPPGTELVVRAIQILLGKRGIELTDWKAQRTIMRPPEAFLKMLKGYDVSKMDPKIIKALKTPELLGNPVFCWEQMCKKSKAAAGLLIWVINVVICGEYYINQRSQQRQASASGSRSGFVSQSVVQDVSQVEERKVVKSQRPQNHPPARDRPRPIIRAAGQKSLESLTKNKMKADQMERFVQRTIAEGQPFTDPDFKPQRSSLYDPRIDDEIDRGLYDSFTWRRAGEIYNPAYIFEDGIEPNDINQGQLGDCYFLAALSSLAEFPEDVEQMFVTKEINAAGIYLVKFIINGQETPVIIDDFLPCGQNGQPVFATCRDGELWVSLLEKAWAKLHGTYARTEGGLPCFAVNHITGVPTESHQHDRIESKEDFFDMLQSADHRNFVMMVASTGQGENRNAEGVISGHAYSLISIHELNHRGKEIKLLKLRNPWGSGEWQGDWSDNSPLWTPQLKQKCGFVDGDDGVFFIELDDYLQHFSWTSICVEKDDDKYKHSQLYHSFGSLDESPMPQAFFSFILDEAVDFNEKAFAISVLQQGDRLMNYRKKDPRQKFDPSRFNIVLFTAAGEFVNARFGSHFTFSLLNQKITLNAGKYYFMVDPIWNTSTDNAEEYKEVLIDIYGPRAVDIEPVSDAEGMEHLSRAFKHAAKTKNLEKQYYLEDNEDYGRNVTRISDIKSLGCWYGFIHTQNDSPYAMTETLRLDLTGLEVAHPKPNSGSDFNFTIQPGEDHIVILRRTEAKCSYGLQYMTEPRPISFQEMQEEAEAMDDSEANFFGDSKAYFKLFNSANGSCFFFENREKRMTLKANFELQVDNLQIVDSPPGATRFAIQLGPGEKSYTMLKPIQEGEATGIQMRFEHSFK